ncbi:MAG: hypothetical protein ACYTE3_08490 [Planctomycetota bacterium]|jgi:hypothetical protein
MELRHRILQFNNSPKYDIVKDELDRLGCKYKRNESSIECTFRDEDDTAQHLLAFAKSYDLLLQSYLQYSDDEVMNAEWVISSVGEYQYPQPEDGYLEATYNMGNACPRCGIGGVQDKPFRLKKAFTQKRSKFLGLFWVHDEIFVRPVIRQMFEQAGICGVSYHDVIHHRSNKVFDDVFQMRIDSIIGPALITDDLSPVTCKPQNEESHIKALGGHQRDESEYSYCGRVKYHYPLTKPIKFKANALKGFPDFAKSHEFYGGGYAADRFILARNRVVQFVRDNKLRGLEFLRPVHLV